KKKKIKKEKSDIVKIIEHDNNLLLEARALWPTDPYLKYPKTGIPKYLKGNTEAYKKSIIDTSSKSNNQGIKNSKEELKPIKLVPVDLSE
ncbi:MAG: hypothetical protein OEL54_06830, partial [Flavobacteriaceae bacterium]|nr:hypothetical protein [Flavobacteriaceae bacterium]